MCREYAGVRIVCAKGNHLKNAPARITSMAGKARMIETLLRVSLNSPVRNYGF